MTNRDAKTALFLASAVAGLVALAGPVSAEDAAKAEGEKVKCFGVNKCKGAGGCAGESNACAGQNGCAGHGHVMLEKETCLSIQGGRLTADAKGK